MTPIQARIIYCFNDSKTEIQDLLIYHIPRVGDYIYYQYWDCEVYYVGWTPDFQKIDIKIDCSNVDR